MKTKAEQMRDDIKSVQKNMRFTKITCTRSIHGSNGHTFVGYSVMWNSVQNDAGGMGVDHELVLSDGEIAANGMTRQQAVLAQYMLARQVDIAAAESAMASGGISPSQCASIVNMAKDNYEKLIERLYREPSGNVPK